MKYKIITPAGTVEYRDDSNPPAGAVLITDAEYDAEIAALSAPQPLTFNQSLREIEDAFDNHIDEVAAARGYGRVGVSPSQACIGYAAYPNQWQAEAVKYGQWVAVCCAALIQGRQDVIAGTRPMPTQAQAIAELPLMVW